ncbi:MAG: hypothetical protein KJ901_02905, partial [Gammaproteobacteria bacterium]|nr:hypothetical protein [Gammaproteobacteria bacterium]
MQEAAHILNESHTSTASTIPRQPLAGGVVWDAARLKPTDGMVHIDADAMGELRALVASLRNDPLPLEALEPEDFRLDA